MITILVSTFEIEIVIYYIYANRSNSLFIYVGIDSNAQSNKRQCIYIKLTTPDSICDQI